MKIPKNIEHIEALQAMAEATKMEHINTLPENVKEQILKLDKVVKECDVPICAFVFVDGESIRFVNFGKGKESYIEVISEYSRYTHMMLHNLLYITCKSFSVPIEISIKIDGEVKTIYHNNGFTNSDGSEG